MFDDRWRSTGKEQYQASTLTPPLPKPRATSTSHKTPAILPAPSKITQPTALPQQWCQTQLHGLEDLDAPPRAFRPAPACRRLAIMPNCVRIPVSTTSPLSKRSTRDRPQQGKKQKEDTAPGTFGVWGSTALKAKPGTFGYITITV